MTACLRETSGSGSTMSVPSRPIVSPASIGRTRPAIGRCSTNISLLTVILAVRIAPSGPMLHGLHRPVLIGLHGLASAWNRQEEDGGDPRGGGGGSRLP